MEQNMQLPGTPEQQAQPEQPQAQPAQGQQPFPADEEEALRFSNDILQVMIDDETRANHIKGLSQIEEAQKVDGLAIMATNIVGNRITDVRAQSGRPIEMELAIGALEAVVKKLSQFAAGEGFFEVTPEEQKAVVEKSAVNLDQMAAGGGQ